MHSVLPWYTLLLLLLRESHWLLRRILSNLAWALAGLLLALRLQIFDGGGPEMLLVDISEREHIAQSVRYLDVPAPVGTLAIAKALVACVGQAVLSDCHCCL